MKKLLNKKVDSGITLIALVITIVVLIILAAILINLTLGENGIVRYSEEWSNTNQIPRSKRKTTNSTSRYSSKMSC